jgi:mono/diheme cytochrome c family protein
MFRRVVDVVEVLALVAAAVFVVMLFANEPSTGTAGGPTTPGATLFAANCASCHGADGGGGIGPQLAGGAVTHDFPNLDDQVAFVTDGRGGMPAFGGRLTPAQIRQVVEYTRTL